MPDHGSRRSAYPDLSPGIFDSPTQWSRGVGILRSDRFGLFPEDGHHGFRRSASLERRVFRSPSHRAPGQTRTGLIGNPARRPLACSGDMYSTVPITRPAEVCAAVDIRNLSSLGIVSLARPKSRIFTKPSRRPSGFRVLSLDARCPLHAPSPALPQPARRYQSLFVSEPGLSRQLAQGLPLHQLHCHILGGSTRPSS